MLKSNCGFARMKARATFRSKPFRKIGVMVPLTMHSTQSISYIRSIY
jgi:hypothetical protein